MVKTLSWSSATLLQCMMESVLYGIFIVLFIESIRTLLRRRHRSEGINRLLVIATPLLFFFATLHIIGTTWMRVYTGFILYPEGPEACLTLITNTGKTLGQAGQISGVALADFMTVHRCWVIWNRNWLVIAVPTLTLIATFVSSVIFVTVQHHVDVHTSVFNVTVTRWTEAWLASSLATTGLCTLLIIYKLISIQRRLHDDGITLNVAARGSRGGTLASRAVFIIVESAAIYSLNNLLYCVLYSVEQVPETWFSGMESTIASITFSLIIIRVDKAAVGTVQSRSGVSAAIPIRRQEARLDNGDVLEMKTTTLGESQSTPSSTREDWV